MNSRFSVVELDPVERAILKALQRDARLSMRALAQLVGVSTPTASAKVRALEEVGLIRGYRAVLDPRLLGRTAMLLEVEAQPSDARAVAERLGALPGVDDVVETTGGRLFARCFADGQEGLQALLSQLAAIEGIHAHKLHPVVGETPGAGHDLDEGARLSLACHFCAGPIHGAGVKRRLDEGGRARDHWFCCRNCAADYEARLARLTEAAGSARRG